MTSSKRPDERGGSKRYALLIYSQEPSTPPGPKEIEANAKAAASSVKDITDRGILQAGAPLRPTATATTVRAKDGKLLTTDGPFAETKEQLAGFFLIECPDLDAAIELAGKLATAMASSVEVRPISTLMEEAVQAIY